MFSRVMLALGLKAEQKFAQWNMPVSSSTKIKNVKAKAMETIRWDWESVRQLVLLEHEGD